MRVEYTFNLEQVDVPCFSVETTEGPGKLFTLTTLILNVLAEKDRVDIIFHSPNEADLPKKIESFEAILATGPSAPDLRYEAGRSGALGSSYFSWLSILAR